MFDFFAKRKLRQLLSNPKYRFRSLPRLHAAVGRTPEATKALLYEIGARESRRDPELFGLVSRVGAPRRRREASSC